MHTLRQFFTDPQLFYDSERQCRALEMAITLREAEPLYYIECRPLGQLLDSIAENLKLRFSDSKLSSLKRPTSGLHHPGSNARGDEEDKYNPAMAGIFDCFGDYLSEVQEALLREGADAGSPHTLVALTQLDKKAVRTQEELQQDLCSLIPSLCRFTYVTLSKGIFLTTSTDEYRDVHAVEVMLQSLSNLFFYTIPRLLFNFNSDIEDPVRFEFNSESTCFMMKAAVETLTSLVALIQYHDNHGPIFLIPGDPGNGSNEKSLEHVLPSDTDYTRVVKLSSLDHLLFAIGKEVLPILGDYLMQCNKFLSSMYIVTNPHSKSLVTLNASISSISLSILFFIHEILALTFVDSNRILYEQPSIPVDDTVGTVHTKSFKKIRNSSDPYANEFLTRKSISKDKPNKTAPGTLKTREEVHDCILSVIISNKIIDQILLFLQAPDGSRPYLLALSILQLFPFERMNASSYASTTLAKICIEKFHYYFSVKKHDFNYKRLHRKEINLQLSYLCLVARISRQKSPFLSVLCTTIRLSSDEEFINKPKKTSTLDTEAEPGQQTFNFISDYVIELISRYGRHEFHPVRHALVYLNGPAQLEEIMQAGMTISNDTLIFGQSRVGATAGPADMQQFSGRTSRTRRSAVKETGMGRSFIKSLAHPISGPGPLGNGGTIDGGGLMMFGASARNTPALDPSTKKSNAFTGGAGERSAAILKLYAGKSAMTPDHKSKNVATSKVNQELSNNYIYISKTIQPNANTMATEHKAGLVRRYKQNYNFRSNVPEGYTINYIELNKQRLSERKIVEEDYQRQMALVKQQDIDEDEYILHSKDISNHMRAVRMYEALEEREKRNRRMLNACKAKIYTDMRKSMAVIMRNGTYEAEHFDDCVTIKNRESLMGKLAATMGNGPLDSNFALISNSLEHIDPIYEVLYIYHCMTILRNLICHSSTMADNRTRAILATIKPDLLKALVYFISTQNPVLLSISFDILFEIIVFPSGLSEYLQYGVDSPFTETETINSTAKGIAKKDYSVSVWEILNYVDFSALLCSMIAVGQADAIAFLMRFFQRPTNQSFATRGAGSISGAVEATSYENNAPISHLCESVIRQFVVFIDPLVQFFYSTNDVEMQQIALTAISFLCFSCGPIAKPLIGTHIAEHSLEVLSGTIIDSMRTPNHFNKLPAIVAAYAIFAAPRDTRAAAACLQSNVLMSICTMFLTRFSGIDKESEKAKLSYADIVTIRFLTDILSSGNAEVLEYLQSNTALQSAVCKLYRRWLQTNKMIHVDEDTLVLLPGTEKRAAKRSIPRGCLYELSSDFIQTNSTLQQTNSPVDLIECLRSGSVRTTATSCSRPVKNIIHQYSNIVAIQTQICENLGNDESFELLDLFQNKDYDDNNILSSSVTLTGVPASADEEERDLEHRHASSEYRERFTKGKRGDLLKLNSAPNYKEWFQPLLDAPTVEKSTIELPPEILDMMLLDLNTLILSFFRALYHNLASLNCKVTIFEPKHESLLKSALTQASLRSNALSRQTSLNSTKRLTSTTSDLNISNLIGPAVTLPSLASTTTTAPPDSLLGSIKPGLNLNLALPVIPKLGAGRMEIDLVPKEEQKPEELEVTLRLPTIDVLTIIAMIGYGLKNTLEIYEKTSNIEFTSVDRCFLKEAASRVEQRIEILSKQGFTLLQKERDIQLGEEAEYYSSMLK